MPAAAKAAEPSIRDTLFGDMPMSHWPAGAAKGEPWDHFVKARDAFQSGDVADAVKIWKKITEMDALESRHTLQAWHFLRHAGVQAPPAKAKQLLGVVIEVPMDDGLDLLAAYPERTARYYNYTGAGVVWERPNTDMDALIDALLGAAQPILNAIGPWENERPGVPKAGGLRINLLSPAGLHFGEGPFNALAGDPMAKPLVAAAIALMQKMVALNP